MVSSGMLRHLRHVCRSVEQHQGAVQDLRQGPLVTLSVLRVIASDPTGPPRAERPSPSDRATARPSDRASRADCAPRRAKRAMPPFAGGSVTARDESRSSAVSNGQPDGDFIDVPARILPGYARSQEWLREAEGSRSTEIERGHRCAMTRIAVTDSTGKVDAARS